MHDFQTTFGGTRMATSVGGVLTGRGADYIILDDPLKPDEALSDTQRQKVNDWYDNTLLSRLNSKADGCIILVMQRLHMSDLAGYLMEKEDWNILVLPAIAEQDECIPYDTIFGRRIFRRMEGDVLHPDRDNLKTFQEIEKAMGGYNFSAQYQQRPIPLGGAMVKHEWLRRHDYGSLLAPLQRREFWLVIQSWDTANKAGELNDYSVCTTWGYKEEKFYLLDVFRKRLNYPDLKRAIIDQARRYQPNNILIEDKASGTQLIQDLKADGVRPVTSYTPVPGMDKQMRLHAVTALFENGLVLLPQEARWLKDYELELTGFPGAAHDDQVDSTTQGLDFLKSKKSYAVWAKLAR